MMNEYERITKSDYFDKIKIYLSDAIHRHPDFAKDKFQAMSIILEEIGELTKEINDDKKEFACVELFHAIATLTRLYGMFLVEDSLKGEKCCGEN